MKTKKLVETQDLMLRSPSLLLYGIIIGISINFGIQKIVDLNFTYDISLNFCTFLITAIRFFHGNYIYHEKPRVERPFLFMTNFYFNVAELIALCMISILITDGIKFIYTLFLLSVIDISWVFISVISFKISEARTFFTWGLLNAMSVVFLSILIIFDKKAVGTTSLIIFIFYFFITFLDYYICKNYYFVMEKDENTFVSETM